MTMEIGEICCEMVEIYIFQNQHSIVWIFITTEQPARAAAHCQYYLNTTNIAQIPSHNITSNMGQICCTNIFLDVPITLVSMSAICETSYKLN